MSTKTRADLISEVWQGLTNAQSAQAIPAEDSTDIDSAIDDVCEDLGARNVYYIGDAENFDAAPFRYLVDIVSERIAYKFGRPGVQQRVDAAEDNLRVLTRINRGSGRLLRTEPITRRGMRILGSWGR